MDPIVDWTRIAVTLIRSFFEFLTKKKQSRRGNGDLR